MLDVRSATDRDAGQLLALREAAAAWLRASGIRQWEPGEVAVEQIRAQITRGEWFVHRSEGRIAAALRLLWADPEFWGHRPDDAAYVHGLVIDRLYAGQGLGGQLLDWAERRARDAGRGFLRLDCVETNDRLRRYYRDRGLREVGCTGEQGSWHAAVLFEKALGD